MFGGVGFMLNGNLVVGVWQNSLIARLGSEQGEEALKQAHVSEFNITGRSMKGWVLVAPEGVEHEEQLTVWIRRAEAFVVTLIATIAGCFAYEIFFSHPIWREAVVGLIPRAEILPIIDDAVTTICGAESA